MHMLRIGLVLALLVSSGHAEEDVVESMVGVPGEAPLVGQLDSLDAVPQASDPAAAARAADAMATRAPRSHRINPVPPTVEEVVR